MKPNVDKVFGPDVCAMRRDVSFGPHAPYVVHLTDAFGNGPAQRRIATMLLGLVEAGLELVCVEGMFGPVPPGHVQAARQRAQEKGSSLRLVEQGKIGYDEYLLVNARRPIELFGADDRPLYGQIHTLMKSLIPAREPWCLLFAAVRADLKRDGLAPLSSDYADFLHNIDALGASFTDKIDYLLEWAGKLGLDISALRNFQRILDTRRLETTIDFEAANREREQLQQQLAGTIDEPDVLLLQTFRLLGLPADDATPRALAAVLADGGLNGVSLAGRVARTPLGQVLRHGLKAEGLTALSPDPDEVLALFRRSVHRIGDELAALVAATRPGEGGAPEVLGYAAMAQVMSFLMELMPLLGLRDEQYPNLIRYTHYLNRFAGVSLMTVLQELEANENQVAAGLARTDEDRLHRSLVERLTLLEGLASLQIGRGEVKRLQALSGDLDHEQLCDELAEFIPASEHLRALRDKEEPFEEEVDVALRYYNLMTARGNAMADNTLARMRDTGRDVAVLVTGGYHQEAISATLSRQSISHTVILPVLDRETTAEESGRYFQTLMAR